MLVETARQIHALTPVAEGKPFLAAVRRERDLRLESYRQRMVGPDSLWREWRAGLPTGELLQQAVLKRFEVWASTLDPNPRRTHEVAQSSLLFYDSLSEFGLVPLGEQETVRARRILNLAALTQDVGRAQGEKDHHKNSRRLLRKLELPPGWSAEDLTLAGMVARFHRGALPDAQKSYAALPPENRYLADLLAGILRLADSVTTDDPVIRHISLSYEKGVVRIVVPGYRSRGRQARAIAGARHLLEETLKLPVLVRDLSMTSGGQPN